MIRENISIDFYDGRPRQIRVLLPDDFETSGEAYPVLYLFDGQNVFDPEDSYTGVTWEVREAMEALVASGEADPMIIIGIDHAGPRRLQEYGPFDLKYRRSPLPGEGQRFGEFLVEELIPELEARYPIIAEPWARAIAGSSMGGLITAYLALRYPDQFGSAGIFSLASWVSKRSFNKFVRHHARPTDTRFYIQVGAREGLNVATGRESQKGSRAYVRATEDLIRQLEKGGVEPAQITLRVGEDHWHSESCWREYMPEFILWLQEKA